MNVEHMRINGVARITPRVHGDDRGFFSEVYNARDLAEANIELEFVQDNHSFSADAGTVRGLHFQLPPVAQDKLVRVTRGRILDVAVDMRNDSPTFGQHVACELSRENWQQLLVPAGCAHGFVTLERNTEVLYKVTEFYSRQHDAGIYFADPDLGIDWQYAFEEMTISSKDAALPGFAEFLRNNPF